MEVNGEQACKVGTGDRRLCDGVSHCERGCLLVGFIYTGSDRASFVGDVCLWRSIALYWRIRRSGIDPNRVGSLFFDQEIPTEIVCTCKQRKYYDWQICASRNVSAGTP